MIWGKTKMPGASRRGQRGFTVTELVVVVGIMGLIYTIAMPRFSTFLAKARQTEAKNGLKSIVALQFSFQAERGVFSAGSGGGRAAAPNDCVDDDILAIGFVTNCATSRYIYTAPFGDAVGFTAHAFSPVNGRICQCRAPIYGLAYDGWGVNELGRVYSSFSDALIFRPGINVQGDCTRSCR